MREKPVKWKIKMRLRKLFQTKSKRNVLLIQCDGFAQSISGRQTAGRVLTHAPRNSTVEAFPSCPRMYRVM
jgi:hypothetical protein